MRLSRAAGWLALAATAGLLLTGAKGCGQTGGGTTIMYGNPPVATLVRPLGVPISGKHAGQTAMIAAGAALSAAAAQRLAHVMGGTSAILATTGDPCLNRPDGEQIATWRNLPNLRFAFLDCAGWRQLQNTRLSIKRRVGISHVVRCITKALRLTLPRPVSTGVLYDWTAPMPYGTGELGPILAQVIVAPSGRIVSAYSNLWYKCAKDA